VLRKKQRQERIRDRLAASGRLSALALARQLRVTPMTIRRDLAAMEKAGLLTRTHGGCVLQSPFVAELSFPEKQRRRQAHKAAIAREVVRRMRPGDAVYVDTGTTALQVARALPSDLGVKVFTNNLRIAMELFGRAGVDVVVYGGALAARNPDLVGGSALEQIRLRRLDMAVVGGDALDAAKGEFHSADEGTALLSRAAQRQAERIVVAMDSSKIGKRGLAVVGRLKPGTVLITDDEIGKADRAAIRATGASLICVAAGRGKA